MKNLFFYGTDDDVPCRNGEVPPEQLLREEPPNLSLHGIPGEMLRFVSETQLSDRALWSKFVNEFRLSSDSRDKGWRGEFWGKMMRGASLVCAAQKDISLYHILCDTVSDLLSTEDSCGRITTYSRETEFSGWDMWVRKYVLLGMWYFCRLCREEELKQRVVASMCRQVDYIAAHVGERAAGKLPICETSKWYGGLNSCSILEPVVKLYRLTGIPRYLQFAHYIVAQGACQFEDLYELAFIGARAPYQYPVTKAYEMMSCFEGLIDYYEVTKEEKYREAVENFAYRVAETEVSVIGGIGCSMECFDHGAMRQTSVPGSRMMQETCATVTWMRLCYRMFHLTGNSFFADCFEQSFYNAYAGALNTERRVNAAVFPPYVIPADGTPVPTLLPFDSYSPLRRGVRGAAIGGAKLLADRSYYGCCACIGSVGIGTVHELAAVRMAGGLLVQLYFPCELLFKTPSGRLSALRTETDYPAEGVVKMTLDLKRPERFILGLRIPAWSQSSRITVNGCLQSVTLGYTLLEREWQNGDMVLLHLDMRVAVIRAPHYERDVLNAEIDWNSGTNVQTEDVASPGAAHYIALRRGPLMLARDSRVSGELSPIGDRFGNQSHMEPVPAERLPFSHLAAFRISQQDRTAFTVVDYGSAGKAWNETSATEVWIPTHGSIQ